MALVGNVYEIRSDATAGNVNGGGFNPLNAGMLTDLTTDSNTANTSAPIVSSASYNFVAEDVGHWLYIKAGTNWTPGWYNIQSVASNKATLEAAIGSANVRQVVNNLYIANTVIGCATVGTPTGGTFTIDYSQGTTAILALTDFASVNNSAVLTTATGGFTPVMVGNLVKLASGTNATVGWYELTVYTNGNTMTVDRDCAGAADLSAGVGKVGGALSLGSSDDAVFELGVAASPSSRYFVRGGSSITYTLGGTVSSSKGGQASSPIIWESYDTVRGNRPTGATRPTFACAATVLTWTAAGHTWVIGFIGTGTSTNVFTTTTTYGNKFINCKAVNSSPTTFRNAFGSSATEPMFIRCEAVSYAGYGFAPTGSTPFLYECYAHDCSIGAGGFGTSRHIVNCLFSSCYTDGIRMSSGTICHLLNNTIYGAENKLGVGINFEAGATHHVVSNNNIYGCVTGIAVADVGVNSLSLNNNFYNNTNDVTDATKWQKGVGDTAIDPSFVSVTQRTGSTATTTAGNHLVQSGATFQTWGVVAGDYVYISAGTGVTAQVYGILSVDSETQITTDVTLSANATADKVWQITTGRNFAIGPALKATGTPGAFPGGLTTGYMDVGAFQRQEAGAGGSFASFG